MRPNPPRLLPLFAILLLAALLRFYNLSGQSLWSDEGNSVALARRGFVEIAQRTAYDIHPPLYYWLLKIWITVFGDSEVGLRSLSVVLGIGLVYVIAVLGRRLFSSRVGLVAAFIAACSPLQIYYAQETRMYMLLTFLGALTVLLSLLILDGDLAQGRRHPSLGILFIVTVTAGLYTHYAYPVILIVINLAVLLGFVVIRLKGVRQPHRDDKENEDIMDSRLRGNDTKHGVRKSFSYVFGGNPRRLKSTLFAWFTLQLIPFLFYLPWLPTAWRQVTTWPSEQQVTSLPIILETVADALIFGLSWPYELGQLSTIVLAFALLVTVGSFFVSPADTSRFLTVLLLWLWFLLPVMVTVAIFSPAFLKFVLIATPALALLLAFVIEQLIVILRGQRQSPIIQKGKTVGGVNSPRLPIYGQSSITRRWLSYIVGGALLSTLMGTSLLALVHYYNNTAFARDNYRGIVQFIKAVGGPDDAVILHAEGQQDVFNYYNQRHALAPSAPVYALPRQRPLDEATTLTELQNIRDTANKIYGLYWATQQADPEGLIENWLDANLFKATDQWYGNVRLVSYASPQATHGLTIVPVDYWLGPSVQLTGYALARNLVVPGDILQIALQWKTDDMLTENYTIFLQLLDEANHLVGQRDAQPVVPTTTWPVDEAVVDAHGIYIEPGTPPGKHRLIVGLYHSDTGQRLPVNGGDFVDLGEVEVVPPEVPLPLGAFKIQTPLGESRLGLTLLGYDFYKLGHRSAPDTAFYPGDPVQLVVYWLSDRPSSQLTDRVDIRIATDSGGGDGGLARAQLAGVNYPLAEWQPGEIIRAQYDFFLSDLEPGGYRLALKLDGQAEIVLKPFRVE